MTLQDYKVTFPYGATSAPYSKSKPHRGNDRACPQGTPIVIQGVTLGYTGMTGAASGPHCHTQAGTDKACQKDVNPTPYEFQPGTVVAKGKGPQWGYFFTMQVGNRFISYCHQKQMPICSVGQVIKAPTPPTSKMPPVGSIVRITINRTSFKPGTATPAGVVRPAGGSNYIVRGYDPKFPNRIIINSASAGGTVAVALYYVNGTRIEGWS